ncbi:cytochrome P450 [Trametes coccinea BRFM310]|uniref:Cytochrome P450 n=1 Tax=Trametes coccinea (strain BRFM310) TaxID=1353009 RepID=A0A1Y2IMI2_TRAC3|nr:cytochrome P450 [Trametes coccinea BRFM310]
MSLLVTADPLVLTGGVLLLSISLLAIAYPDRFVTSRAIHNVPGPQGIPILGNVLHVIPYQGRTLEWLKYLIDTYGPLCTFTLPVYGRGILINRPEWLAHIKHHDMHWYSRGAHELAILGEFPGRKTPIVCEGAEWRLLRKAILPIFTVKTFTEHVSCAMDRVIRETRELLTDASEKGIAVDWNDLSGRITLSIFTLSSMDLDLGLIESDVGCLQQAFELCDAIAMLNRISSRRLLNPLWRWTEIFSGDRVRFKQARAYVRNLVASIVHKRKAEISEGEKGHVNDWLSELLVRIDDPAAIEDLLVVLLFAGADNTQNSFAWSLYSLMAAPQWLERLRAEAIKNKRTDGEVKYEDLSRYHVHLAVFYETIRLWPGLPKNGRLAVHEDVLPALPEHGLPATKIEKGDFVFWSDYHMMRNEMVWGPTANVFDPGRHLDELGHFVRPSAPNFAGFGAGPRFCPAAQLVAYEYVTCMAGILPYFTFSAVTYDPATGETLSAPEMVDALTPTMGGPFMVNVKQHEGMQ